MPSASSLSQWKQLVNNSLAIYKDTYMNRGCPMKYDKVWHTWLLNPRQPNYRSESLAFSMAHIYRNEYSMWSNLYYYQYMIVRRTLCSIAVSSTT